MDQITRYQVVIENLLGAKAQRDTRCPRPGIETCCIFDEINHHYILMDVGWNEEKRAEYILVHVRIKNSKIWVENDGTAEGFAIELVRGGVPPDDVVLGFQHPNMRPYTDFAAV